jgi:Zn-finger nucleic acid-binding protein
MNTGDLMEDLNFCPKCGSSLLTINKKNISFEVSEVVVGVELIKNEAGILQLKIDRMPLNKLYEILDERYMTYADYRKRRGKK